MLGRLIKKNDLRQETEIITVDISDLNTASYLLEITSNHGKIVKQLIKE